MQFGFKYSFSEVIVGILVGCQLKIRFHVKCYNRYLSLWNYVSNCARFHVVVIWEKGICMKPIVFPLKVPYGSKLYSPGTFAFCWWKQLFIVAKWGVVDASRSSEHGGWHNHGALGFQVLWSYYGNWMGRQYQLTSYWHYFLGLSYNCVSQFQYFDSYFKHYHLLHCINLKWDVKCNQCLKKVLNRSLCVCCFIY